MADESKVGVEQGEAEGDAAAKAAAAAQAEAAAGDDEDADESAQAAERAARDEYLARVEAAAARAEAAAARIAGAGNMAQAAPPPTADQSMEQSLLRERDAILAEERSLNDAIVKEGLTGELLMRRQNWMDRKSEFRATAQLELTRRQEHERETSDLGKEADWKAFAAQHRGSDLSILRDAWERRQERASKASEKPRVKPTAGAERTIVDVSGAQEVSAVEKKARTMNDAQIASRQEELRKSGKLDELRTFVSDVRSGRIISKN